MKSQTKTKVMALVLSTSILFTTSTAYADKLTDLRNQKNQAQTKASEKKSSVGNLNSQRDGVYNKIATLTGEIETLDIQVDELQKQLNDLNSTIQSTQNEINLLKEDINKNEEAFIKRVKAMYMNSKMGSVEVLLSSDDFNDFLSRASMMKFVAEYDKNILNDLKHDKLELDAKEAELKGKKASLEIAQKSLNNKIAELNGAVDEQNQLMEKIAGEIEITEGEISALEAEARSIDGEINKEQKRIAEAKAKAAAEARARQILKQKEAARKAAAEASKKAQESASTGSSNSTSTPSYNDSSYGSGKLLWPLPSSHNITSYYGYRSHPIGGRANFHLGIDIAAPMGTSIHAASSGTVIHAAYTGSYGNLMKVQHDNGLVTYYAHCSGFIASVGQRVSAKQAIARVGSTGNSTGPHLHFEVRSGGAHMNPLNFVN